MKWKHVNLESRLGPRHGGVRVITPESLLLKPVTSMTLHGWGTLVYTERLNHRGTPRR